MTQLLNALESRLQELEYNPSQPRDKDGKWTRAGGGGSDLPLGADPSKHREFLLGGRVFNEDITNTANALARKYALEIADGTRNVRVRADANVVIKILEEGRIKTQFETGTSNGMFDPDTREEVEHTMFGVWDSRPIYGYLGKTGADNGYVDSYGPFSFVLKSDVNARTTMTLGDSLVVGGQPPAPIKLSELSEPDPSRKLLASMPLGGEFPPTTMAMMNQSMIQAIRRNEVINTYDETQIHGGVSLDDVDHIVMFKSNPDHTSWAEGEATRLIEASGIRLVVVEQKKIEDRFSFGLIAALERRAEELACHDKSCAPPPVGTGGSKPAGPSRGHLSPTDDGRVKPDPLYTNIKHMVKLNGGSEMALRGHLIKQFSMSLGDGVTTEVEATSVMSTSIEIRGRFVVDGTHRAGTFIREIRFEDGEIVVYNEALSIKEKYRDQGIAQKFNDKALKYYNEIGVDRIELEAALEFGAYAWARQGYRFDGNSFFKGDVESQRRQWVDDRLNYMKAHTYKLTTPRDGAPTPAYLEFEQELIAIGNASRRGADIQPIHLASLGFDNPDFIGDNGMWPGKAALVQTANNNSDLRTWHGVYYLGRESQLD